MKCRFAGEEIFTEGFVVKGTPAADELLGPREANDPHCVNCGAPLTYVFITSVGPMGGDCLATCTGEPSTRSAFRKLTKKVPLAAKYGRASEIALQRASTPDRFVVKVQLLDARPFYLGFVGERELPVAFAAAAYAADELGVALRVDADVPGVKGLKP